MKQKIAPYRHWTANLAPRIRAAVIRRRGMILETYLAYRMPATLIGNDLENLLGAPDTSRSGLRTRNYHENLLARRLRAAVARGLGLILKIHFAHRIPARLIRVLAITFKTYLAHRIRAPGARGLGMILKTYLAHRIWTTVVGGRENILKTHLAPARLIRELLMTLKTYLPHRVWAAGARGLGMILKTYLAQRIRAAVVGLQDWILTWHTGYEPQWPEDSECPQRLDVEALDLERGEDGAHHPAHQQGKEG